MKTERYRGSANRVTLAAVAVCVLALTLACEAAAQKWPEKTVRIVTPFGPGGGTTDVFARILAQRLSEVLGQQFIVDNRPGAGSTLGTEFVAQSPADGYTLPDDLGVVLVQPGPLSEAALRLDQRFRAGLAGRERAARDRRAAVAPGQGSAGLRAGIARGQARQVLYASSGPGSAMHLAGALFGDRHQHPAHARRHTRGGGATATAVMGGEATTAFNTLETVLSLIQAKRLRPLAVSTRERAPALPDVPTVDGAGVQGLRGDRLVRPACARRHAARDRRALSSEISRRRWRRRPIRERAAQEGATPVGNKPAEFERFVRGEIAKWTKIIQQAGIKLD